MSEEFETVQVVTKAVLETEPEPFVASPELIAAVQAALTTANARTFSGRNPELGKMIKCQVCSRRHREAYKCEQRFTNRAGDFEYFQENDKGELVPLPRTAVVEGERPTMKQVMGAAAFNKKRFHPHPSKLKLRLIEVTREVFVEKGFDLDDTTEQFQKDLAVARLEAGERVARERKYRNRPASRMPRVKIVPRPKKRVKGVS